MISFKSQLEKDLGVFINFDEFGSTHEVNGKSVVCIVDEDIFEERGKSKEEQSFAGVYEKTKSIFVKMEDIEKPSIQERLTLDGNFYTVSHVIETEHLYEIQITRNDY